jgi:hypothetical protein
MKFSGDSCVAPPSIVFFFSLFCLNHLFSKHVQPEFVKVAMKTIGADTSRVGQEKARAA